MTIRRTTPYSGGPTYVGGINNPPSAEPTPGAGLWTEGPNLVTSNPDFETTNIDDWYQLFGVETISRETASPLAGTGSIHVVVPGTEGAEEGLEYITANDSVESRSTVRVRFKVRGTLGTVYIRVQFQSLSPARTFEMIPWMSAVPAETTTITRDLVAPDHIFSLDSADASLSFRVRLRWAAWNSAADFLVDDVYCGILTPA